MSGQIESNAEHAGAGGTQHQQPPTRQAELAFGVLAVAVAIVLATQLGSELTWKARQPIYKQPGFFSLVGIVGMLAFGVIELVLCWLRYRATPDRTLGPETRYFVRAVEFAVWFMAYVLVVPYAGYLLSTLVLSVALTWRLGYRRRVTLAAAAAVGFATVVIFKSFLAVKIPGGALYDYLPAAIRNFMVVNF